jgi:hypothetical protein
MIYQKVLSNTSTEYVTETFRFSGCFRFHSNPFLFITHKYCWDSKKVQISLMAQEPRSWTECGGKAKPDDVTGIARRTSPQS